MTEFGPWTLEQDGPLAVLTIAKPPLNLFDEEVFEGVIAAIDAIGSSDARGMLMRADGKVWTGGVDVNTFHGLSASGGADLWKRGFDLVQAIEDLPFPTIFAAHALCLTWGFELALAHDLVVAAEGAQFGLVEIVVGLTPSMGGTQRLAERAGSARAAQLVMTGALFEAEELERWGVVNYLYDDAVFEGEARALAADLANGPTKAHAMTKHVLRRFREGGLPAADAAVREDAAALFETQDLRGAVRSFLERGPGHAEFEGR